MKLKLNLIAFLCLSLFVTPLFGQSPEGINYQAVARDNAGELLANKSITIKAIVLSGKSASNKVYEETHTVTTSNLGHFNIVIGQGSTNDNFTTIKWSEDPHHLKIEIDQGAGYAVMGTVELQSVPYALHSKTAETVANIEITTEQITDVSSTGAVTGNVLKWNGTAWVAGQDDNTKTTYTAGDGIDVTSAVISAKKNDAIWNAEKLNGTSMNATSAKTGQALRWNGSMWAPADDQSSSSYTAGIGINFNSNVISATPDVAMWNANKLNGIALDNSAKPQINEYLRYNGTKWGYAVADTSPWKINGINTYRIGGMVGINTDDATNRLKVWDSINHTTSGLFIMTDNVMYGGLGTGGTYTAQRSIVLGQGGAFSYAAINVSTGSVHTQGEGIGTYSLASSTGRTSIASYGAASNGNTFNLGVYADARTASNSSSGTNYGIFAIADSAATNYAGYFVGDVNYTGTLTNTSDAKLKYNVKPLPNATDIIKELAPKQYFYKQDGDAGMLNLSPGLQYGFIAQELETVLPNLVKDQVQWNGHKQTGQLEYKAVNYIGLIPVLTQALKEQQAYIEALEKRLSALEKIINE
ncbi:MAG: hypothetical protein ACI9JN_000181 [Bacteroidia bacterium]|jgi:hypothetical protein